MTPLTVPPRSRRQQRAQLVQKLQHVFPAAVLLGAGLKEFLGELPHGWGLALAMTASIEIGERWAVVTTRTGRNRTLDLADLDRGDDVRHALEAAKRALHRVPNA